MSLALVLLRPFWKPIAALAGALLTALRINWLKSKNRALSDENKALRKKEKILTQHQEIDKERSENEAAIDDAGSVDEFNRVWNGDETQG